MLVAKGFDAVLNELGDLGADFEAYVLSVRGWIMGFRKDEEGASAGVVGT